jgi:hypothetical protein
MADRQRQARAYAGHHHDTVSSAEPARFRSLARGRPIIGLRGLIAPSPASCRPVVVFGARYGIGAGGEVLLRAATSAAVRTCRGERASRVAQADHEGVWVGPRSISYIFNGCTRQYVARDQLR